MSRIALACASLAFLLLAVSARAEVTICTEIPNVPFTITKPGIYCLKKNLVITIGPGPAYLAGAIEIEADNVTVDLNDFSLLNKLAGPGNHMNGVVAFHRKNVTVRNGHIEGFSNAVLLGGLFAQRSTVENIRANASNYRGMFVVGADSVIRNNHVTNTGPGDLDSEASGITLVYGENSVIEDNVVSTVSETDLAYGIGVGFSPSVSVRDNTVFNIRDATEKNGIGVVSVTRAVISGNQLLNNPSGNAGIANLGFSSQISCIGNAISGFAPATGGCNTSVGNTIF
jgi:hypothetical protein